MKVLCLIDSLGPGGAQRQLANLAAGLKERGHDIRFLVYHRQEHFLPLLQAAEIDCETLESNSRVTRLLDVRRALRKGKHDVVLAFLTGPSLYAELASLPRRRWGLVIGERSASPRIVRGLESWLRQGHRLADSVVTNSHTTRLLLERSCPFLKDKIATIYNFVDLERFSPTPSELGDESDTLEADTNEGVFRLVVAAGYDENKNMIGLAKALLLLDNDVRRRVVVDWYGSMRQDLAAYESATSFVRANGLESSLRFHDASTSIEKEYLIADAVGLFSYHEGLANALCEAMACARPIIASNVSDAQNLVLDGINGLLCEAGSPRSIADAIEGMAKSRITERRRMGDESRRMALNLFDKHRVLEHYERVLECAANNEKLKGPHWPSDVPDSAEKTARRLGGW